MPFFTYKAINLDGKVIKGLVEVNDIDLAYNSVSSSGLYVLKIRKSNQLAKFYINKIKDRGIKPGHIIEFANNLSVMLKAGLPLLTSLGDIADTIDDKNFKRRIEEIKKMVELGSSFSAALSLRQDIFPDIFINLVSVGEETGRLDKSLSDIVVHLQRMEDLRSAIKRALMYPIFAVTTTTGTLLFWLIYVLPKIAGLFKELGVKLPLITQVLIAASAFSRNNWYIFPLIPFIIFIAYKILSKKEATKYYIDQAKLKAPIIKLIVRNKLLALFAEQFRILIAAGLPIDRSFDMMVKVMDNALFKNAILAMKEDILYGSRIHEAVRKHSMLFPGLVTRLIYIGEETGNLVEQLNYLTEEYIKKLNDTSQKMEKLIEPIVIVIIGLFFMVIIIGLMFPIYNLVSTVGAR